MRLLGLELAPLDVPLERRLQTLAVLFRLTMFFGLMSSIWLLIFLLFTPYFWIPCLYLIWYIYDFDQSLRGGRPSASFRRSILNKWVRDYFPIRLITTSCSGLDPARSYIFGSHPHVLYNLYAYRQKKVHYASAVFNSLYSIGIMGFGANVNFLTDVNGFPERFPGITTYLLGLKLMLHIPLFREFFMAVGICDVSKESIRYLMKKKGTAAIIVVGGVKEIMDAWPGVTRLVLKNRKGFVKAAIENGAYLVPTFTFGENDLYRQVLPNPPGSKIREWQRWFSLKFYVTPVLFYGRGIFNYTFGFMPHRVPLTTVVGSAIPVERSSSPTQEYIDKVHDRYMRELKSLFDQYKVECGYPTEELEFVD